ncbi:MAG: hypothetical protein M3442_01565, partial [Chloroflexota bacterium]|nr:hypothetical protein [Chloroflexota bacterium]
DQALAGNASEVRASMAPTAAGDGEGWHARVVGAAWSLLTRDLIPLDSNAGTYDRFQVGGRLEGVALHLACAVVSEGDQRDFLAATGGADASEGPFMEGVECWLCELAVSEYVPPPGSRRWVRHAFAHRLWLLMEDALARRSPTDLRLGMPLVVEHPREVYLDQLREAYTRSRRRARHGCGWDRRAHPGAA